jgi:hypothetical protein
LNPVVRIRSRHRLEEETNLCDVLWKIRQRREVDQSKRQGHKQAADEGGDEPFAVDWILHSRSVFRANATPDDCFW